MLDSNGYAISAATKHIFDVDALDADHFELAAEVDGAERREMMHILDHGIGAFTLDASHLLAQSDADAKVALINFANCFGVVKSRGDGQSPIWRVQVRDKAPELQSYSEMPGIAPFHTDASYYPVPMKYLLFFVINLPRSVAKRKFSTWGQNCLNSPRSQGGRLHSVAQKA